MAGWTKLHSSIVYSTIWRESKETRLLWITMLAIVDGKGEIQASIPGLADIARLTIAETETALKDLMSPDPYSRSKDKEGRRIEEIDGGWLLINHHKYREKTSTERVQRWREKKQQERDVTLRNVSQRCETLETVETAPDPDPDPEEISSPTDSLLSADADALSLYQDKLTNKNNPSLSSNTTSLLVTNKDKKRKTKKKEYSAEFDHFWGRLLDLNRGYNNRLTTGKWESFKAWKEAKEIPDFPGEEGILAALERQLLSKDWKKNNGDFVPLFSTWLRAGRWTAVLPKTIKQRIQEGEFDD